MAIRYTASGPGMEKRQMSLRVITANRLADGVAVYLAADGSWTERVGDGAIIREPADDARLTALADQAVATQLVVAPEPIEVTERDGGPWPVSYREVIRATGPSVHPAFHRPASREAR